MLGDVDTPALEALTPEERADYLRQFRTGRKLRDGLTRLSTGLAAIILFCMLFACGAIVPFALWMMADRWLGSPLGYPGGVVAAILLAACAGLAIWGTAYFLERHRELEQRRRVLVHLYERSPECPSCRYDLSGAAELPARPGVVRCPECGLVNPRPVFVSPSRTGTPTG